MLALFSKLMWLLPTKDKSKPIEERLFQITITLTIVTILMWSVVGLITGYTWFIEGIYIFALLFYLYLYILFKKGKSFRRVTLVYYLTALLLIAVGWFPSGGIKGAIMHFCVLIYLSGLLVLPLKNYTSFMLGTLVVVVTYVFLEYIFPGLASPYTDTVDHWRDLSIAGVLMLTLMGIAFYLFKREHLHDRDRLTRMNRDLEMEKQKAEMADKAKSQFLATISHEMRTPLNGIVGISELLANTPLNDEQRDLIKNLEISSRVLHGLISDVLDLTMIENGKVILTDAPFNLREGMQQVMDIFESKVAATARVRLTYLHDEHIPETLVGDWKRIRQVIINLINNAVKFTEEGAINVETSLSWKNESMASVRFGVEDTGPGIPGELQDELFQRFFKADKARPIEGSGLGLSISKSLVDMMGGKIWFTSVLHVGTSFFVEVPLKLATRPEAPPQKKKSDAAFFNHLKLLIAEDVEINRMVMLKMLKNLGVKDIDVARDGQEALEKATGRHFDFVLMDLQMPRLNGIEAAYEIRRFFIKKGAPPPVIIAVTANAMKEDAEACKSAGMADFITKPFKGDVIASTLLKHYGRTV